MFDATAGQGQLIFTISAPGKPHDPESWAENAKKRIMEVANTAPQPIRDQAYAFQERMGYIILDAIKSALHDHQAYVKLANDQRG
jgi:hypothetical protein